MMWPGYLLAFYGIFLGHEHRTLIGEGNVRGPQARMVRKRMTDDLNEYCQFAADLGYHPELRAGLAPDVVVELRRLCLEVAHEFPHVVFFAGKLVFQRDASWLIELEYVGDGYVKDDDAADLKPDDILASPSEKPQAPAKPSTDEAPPSGPKSDVPF